MHELIVSDPKIVMGKPVVRGTRITVESIVERVGAGESIEAIVDAHPRLTHEGVLAAISFAAEALKADEVYPVSSGSAECSPVTPRIDSASRLVQASPMEVYRAFAEPGAMERWLPPTDMTGRMLHFDFREGGSYRMRLTFDDPEAGQGKTSDDADEVRVALVRLQEGRAIEQEVVFDAKDPAFAGTMRMVWSFEAVGGGTRVTVRAENVPPGISPEDHAAGLQSTLENLEAFVGQGGRD